MEQRKKEILAKIKSLQSNQKNAERDVRAFENSKYRSETLQLAKLMVSACNEEITKLMKELENL